MSCGFDGRCRSHVKATALLIDEELHCQFQKKEEAQRRLPKAP
jgi:hypothetical protein